MGLATFKPIERRTASTTTAGHEYDEHQYAGSTQNSKHVVSTLNLPVIPVHGSRTFALSPNRQVVAPEPASVDAKVKLIVRAEHVGVHPDAVLVVPAEHSILLSPPVVVIVAPPTSVMVRTKSSGSFSQLITSVSDCSYDCRLLQC